MTKKRAARGDEARRVLERESQKGDQVADERLAAEDVRHGRAPLVRLRQEDHAQVLELGDQRELGEVLHDVIESGCAAIKGDWRERLVELESRLRGYESFARRALLDLELTQGEACLICDALNGAWLLDDMSGSVAGADRSSSPVILRAEIEDSISLNRLDSKWKVNAKKLLAKLAGWGPGEAISVMDGARRFWRNHEKGMEEALQEAGFIRGPEKP